MPSKPSRDNPRNDLTAKYVRSILQYGPETGLFHWRVHRHPYYYIGDKAGYDCAGRVLIGIDTKRYGAARLAWLYMTGKWPKCCIDHTDGNPKNNKWNNLREATHKNNMRNSKKRKHNQWPYKGIKKHTGNKWIARICCNYRQIYLGLFSTPEEAHAAYCQAAKQLHGHFARFG